jgi:hypothetical protein
MSNIQVWTDNRRAAPMSNEAATVRWFPPVVAGQVVVGRDRTFESVDNAVTFVMEELKGMERATAHIATDSREINIEEIRQMYAERKK